MLLMLMIIPLLAAALVPLVSKRLVPRVALAATLATLAVAVSLLAEQPWFTKGATMGLREEKYAEWADMGFSLSLGVDGVSLALVALTALLGPICVLGSWSAITQRVRTYYGWLLILQTAMYGVFLAKDVLLFYVCFEFTLVPMFVLIRLYGSTNRKVASVKFFMYTFTGSVIALAGLVYLAYYNAYVYGFDPLKMTYAKWSWAFADLIKAANSMPLEQQTWVFFAMMLGFAVKVPLFPFHTWLPLAHTEAPTAGSVVLAGVLLKLGTYAIFTFALAFTPLAAIHYAPMIGGLAVAGILVGGLICWVQTDVKKLVAYSSVAHLGFCMLGMFALNVTGLQGSVLYMINHGLSTGALFLCIGFMYERYHTRSMHEIGGLAKRMPIWATFLVFFTMASVGLPGLNGFISEFLCVAGAFQADRSLYLGPGMAGDGLGPTYAFLAGIGMIVGAIYLLYMLGRVAFGPLKEPISHHAHDHDHAHASDAHAADTHALPPDLNAREIGTLLPLAALCLFLGVYPKPLMNMIGQPIEHRVSELERKRPPLSAAAAAQQMRDRPPGAAAPRRPVGEDQVPMPTNLPPIDRTAIPPNPGTIDPVTGKPIPEKAEPETKP